MFEQSFGPAVSLGTTAVNVDANDGDDDNVVPIRPPMPRQPQVQAVLHPQAQAVSQAVGNAQPVPYTQAQLQAQSPMGLGAIPPLRDLALHLAPLLTAGVGGALAGFLATKDVRGAILGGSTTLGFVALVRALSGGMYGIPMQLRMVDGALAVAGSVGAGYIYFLKPGKTAKKVRVPRKRIQFLQREDDDEELDEVEEASE